MILFVAADHAQPDRKCPGSRACIRVVSQSKLDVQVQDVADAIDIDGELPPWFDGTPILLDEVSGAKGRGLARLQRSAQQRSAVRLGEVLREDHVPVVGARLLALEVGRMHLAPHLFEQCLLLRLTLLSR